MSRLYKLWLVRVLIGIACTCAWHGSWAACASETAFDKIACLQASFCPDPETSEERAACFQMITAALQSEKRTGASGASQPRPIAPNAPAKPTVAPNGEVARESQAQESQSEERKGVLGRVTGIFKDKEVEAPAGWSKIVYARPEAGGSELIVLENGEVWAEQKRNPYMKLKYNDFVKITSSQTLIRRSGGRTKVEKVDCAVSPLPSRCRDLDDYL